MGLDPVVLFFVFGLTAGLLKSELKLPPALYETLSILLLLAIGLTGLGMRFVAHTDIVAVKGFGSGLDTPKTREITAALQRLGIEAGTKVLLVLDGATDAVKLSVRNLEKVKLIAADQLNVFDLLNARKLVVSVEALAKIQEVYGDG